MLIQSGDLKLDTFLMDVVDSIPISILVIDRNFNIVLANQYTREKNEGFNWSQSVKCYQFSHNQDSPCHGDDHICPHQRVLKTKDIVRVNHVHYDEFNKKKNVEIIAAPIFDPDGNVEYIIEISRDITRRVDAETALESVFIGTATEVGRDFFRSLVSNLATVLNVKYALVGELVSPGKIQTHAVWTGSEFGDNFEYDLLGTPCQNVINTNICSYPTDIQTLFPEDKILVDMGADGYIGAPLNDADGNTNGILAVLDIKPLVNEKLNRKLLTVFAARAGAELGRKIAEKATETKNTILRGTKNGGHRNFGWWHCPRFQ